jgi:hypothetical protein
MPKGNLEWGSNELEPISSSRPSATARSVNSIRSKAKSEPAVGYLKHSDLLSEVRIIEGNCRAAAIEALLESASLPTTNRAQRRADANRTPKLKWRIIQVGGKRHEDR